MSRRDSDSEKVPAALYDRLTDAPTYAALMYKVQLREEIERIMTTCSPIRAQGGHGDAASSESKDQNLRKIRFSRCCPIAACDAMTGAVPGSDRQTGGNHRGSEQNQNSGDVGC